MTACDLYGENGCTREDHIFEAAPAALRDLKPIPADEMCLCIDETCPSCGHPERITPLPGAGAGEVFGCRRCDHVSRDRKS